MRMVYGLLHMKTNVIKIRWQPRPRWGRRRLRYTFPFTLILAYCLVSTKVLCLNYLGLYMVALPLLYDLCKVSTYLFSCLGLNKFFIHFNDHAVVSCKKISRIKWLPELLTIRTHKIKNIGRSSIKPIRTIISMGKGLVGSRLEGWRIPGSSSTVMTDEQPIKTKYIRLSSSQFPPSAIWRKSDANVPTLYLHHIWQDWFCQNQHPLKWVPNMIVHQRLLDWVHPLTSHPGTPPIRCTSRQPSSRISQRKTVHHNHA